MIYESTAELKERIESLSGRRVPGEVDIFEDTSNYMAIYGGSVLRLADSDYFVLGDTREGRFGIDDQPKFWVKYALDLTTGDYKIIKLVFHEEFQTVIGPVKVRCRRSPQKESAILELVRGDRRFMQGRTVTDPLGNAVRIIDFIRGKSLYVTLEELEVDHEIYFHEHLPGIVTNLVDSVEALVSLHAHGQHHGDVRNDHIFIEEGTGDYRWIDFDFWVNYSDFDLWSLGNIVNFVVGKGIHTFRGVRQRPEQYPGLSGSPGDQDSMLLFRHRVANLRKLFPYVPEEMNRVLMRFSSATDDFYESMGLFLQDLREVFG